MPAAAAHLPRAQSEVGAGRGGDQPVRGGDTLGCRVSANLVAVWMLCEKYRFDLPNLASVLRLLVKLSKAQVKQLSQPQAFQAGFPCVHINLMMLLIRILTFKCD